MSMLLCTERTLFQHQISQLRLYFLQIRPYFLIFKGKKEEQVQLQLCLYICLQALYIRPLKLLFIVIKIKILMSQIFVESTQHIIKTDMSLESEPGFSYDFMQLFRIVFYIIVFLKIIELSFFRKKKLSLKERISRKFLFAHQEMLKQFTEEDKSSMEIIINNTLKNSKIENNSKKVRSKKTQKRVNFQTNKNDYYDPKSLKNDDDEIYLDIEQKQNLIKFGQDEPFESKKIQDQFHEREDISTLNEKASELSTEASDLTNQKSEITTEEKSKVDPYSQNEEKWTLQNDKNQQHKKQD